MTRNPGVQGQASLGKQADDDEKCWITNLGKQADDERSWTAGQASLGKSADDETSWMARLASLCKTS